MKVLIVSDLYKPTINGVVTSIVNLKSGLEAQGHDVRVLTLALGKKSYYEDGVYYIGSIDAGKIYPDARFTFKNTKKEEDEIINWNPDVIHTQNEFSTFFIARRIAKRMKSIPRIHTYHTVYSDYTHYFFKTKKLGVTAVIACTKLLGRSVSCIIAPTQKIYNILNTYKVACPVHIIPSGIFLEKFYREVQEDELIEMKNNLDISEKDLVLLSVSRLGREKNIDELVCYMTKLKGKNVKLIVVGDGPERKRLNRLAEKLQLTDIVKFTGMVSPKKVSVYYHLADLFVSASTSEAQGLTYIEALATGTPILCRNDECLEGVLEEGKNGYSFTNEREFFEKLKIYLNEEGKEQMSLNAIQTTAKYSKECFVESILNLYELYEKKLSYTERKRKRIGYSFLRQRYLIRYMKKRIK